MLYTVHALNDLAAGLSGKLKSYEDHSPSEHLAVLLRVSVLADTQDDGKELAHAARDALAGTLKTMTAVDFVGGVLRMLQTANAQVSQRFELLQWVSITIICAQVQYAVLSVLKDRVGDIADSTRERLTESMKQVIDCIKTTLSGEPESRLTVIALQAAESVTRTADTGELNTIATLVPLVLARVRVRATSSVALAALLSMR